MNSLSDKQGTGTKKRTNGEPPARTSAPWRGDKARGLIGNPAGVTIVGPQSGAAFRSDADEKPKIRSGANFSAIINAHIKVSAGDEA